MCCLPCFVTTNIKKSVSRSIRQIIIRELKLWLIVYICRQLMSEMRFKRISALFIVLATTVMMAHSIIPHHHHYGMVTDAVSQCRHEIEESSLKGHPAESGEDSCCRLNQEMLVPYKSIRSGEDLQDERSVPGFLPSLTVALLNLTDPRSVSGCAAGISLQGDVSRYLFLLSNPRGLRAPPRI